MCLLMLGSCSVSKDPVRKEIMDLVNGKVADTSSYIYSLPFKEGHSFRIIQGYFSHFSHKERAALDFNMKRGTEVYAARGGTVVRVKEDGDRGGLNKKYRPYGNNIVIQHADGTRAGYWHLQKNGAFVKAGDTVSTGQLIALSGKTGYAAVPHLHFLVWKTTAAGHWQQIGTRFQTSGGVRYLRSWRRYRRPTLKR